ncbi:putative inorganic phosphate cotransporter isoform X2 [Diabrotica undecimpunctata]|uniref:putative inorganic phosphate cotransporter isoform X2 n=1 Tax=Diabrotica undecimpunctata TaxID=50387 RepID=UPI003B640FFD
MSISPILALQSSMDIYVLEIYDWKNKNIILSSFFWGYPFLQIVAGILTRTYGTKYFLLASIGVNSVICLTIPTIAKRFGSIGVMVCRALMGLAQGVLYPSVYTILSKWVPVSERAQMGGFALSGAPFATIVTMPIVAYISASWYGWPWSFYFFGILGLLWMVHYCIWGASSPGSHSTISEREKMFIESNIDEVDTNLKVPWKDILKSGPFWAIFVSTLGQAWGFQTMITEIPNYINKVMKCDMKSNGLLSAAPYLACFLLLIGFGSAADWIINRKILTVLTTRKIFTAVGSFIPAAALLVLSYLPDDTIVWSVIMLVIAVGVQAAAVGGFEVNHLDLSPNYAGIILGICNTFGETLSIFGPTAVHLIVIDETNKNQWRIIFIAMAVSYMVTCLIFVILASSDVQIWDSITKNKTKTTTKNNNKIYEGREVDVSI